jgi:hypothetical protein
MATPTIYRSTDSSAPAITGEVSKLRLALNAILVDGYGSQAAAGWTKAYEDAGNHLVAYRPGSGLQRYLYINDSPTQVSEARRYRAMTSISVGTDPFPALNSVTVKCRKSVTEDTTERPWICLATDNTVYLIIFGNQTTFGSFDGGDAHLAFGQLLNSPVPDSQFLTFVLGALDTSTTSTTTTVTRQAFLYNNNSSGTAPLGNVEGFPSQVAVSARILQSARVPWNEVLSGGSSFPAYPDPATGDLLIAPYYVQPESTFYVVGTLPGLWLVCHPASSFTSMDTFTGTGTISGRTFILIKTGAGVLAFETGGNW